MAGDADRHDDEREQRQRVGKSRIELHLAADQGGDLHGDQVDVGPGQGPSRRIGAESVGDRKSTRLNSSHTVISYAVFCLKKKNKLRCLLVFQSAERSNYSWRLTPSLDQRRAVKPDKRTIRALLDSLRGTQAEQ